MIENYHKNNLLSKYERQSMSKANRFLQYWQGLFSGSGEKDMKLMKRLPRVRKMARKKYSHHSISMI
ncbi:MAG: hypothetical protein AB1480_17950 [Nitrospirota bacterium]